MRKSAFIVMAALALAGCAKEAGKVTAPVPNTRTVTITAGIDGSLTKTAYDQEGKFSWTEGDAIAVMYSDGTQTVPVQFVAEAGGRETVFTGEVPEGYEPTGTATYPFTGQSVGYARNDFVWDEKGYRLWGSFKPDLESPLSGIPLSGTLEADGFYQFRTACGIVKFTVENAPMETYYTYLETPAESGAYLNGWFNLDEDGILRMENAVDGYLERYNWNVPSDVNQTLDVYFFVPVGTLPAGTKFEVCGNDWAAIRSFEFAGDVEIARNRVTEIAPVSFEEVTVYTLDDVLGEYEMTVYATGPYSGGYGEPGDIVLEASDNEELGNVMMTKFAGIPGKQYGTFDGVYITFPKDQIFGANPFADADTKPYVALDFYSDGVVDATFQLLSPGKIKAVNAQAMGLRSCTEEDWQTYGGGWPWVLSFSSITAEWKGSGEQTTYVKGEEIPLKQSMIYASDVCSHDGQGVAGMIDGDSSTYWHSNWYYAVQNNDAEYGIYFDITLEQAIDAIQFKYQVRANNANGRPTHIVIGTSQDGTTWTKVADLVAGEGEGAPSDMQSAAAGSWVELPAYAIAASKYIRFGIANSADPGYPDYDLTSDLSADGYKKSTNLAELKLFWAE